MTTTTLKQAPSKKPKRWGIRWPGLYLPLLTVLALVNSQTVVLVGFALGPANRGVSLGIAILVFPIVCGVVINYCLGSRRPWWSLLYLLGATVLIGALAWALNNWRWS